MQVAARAKPGEETGWVGLVMLAKNTFDVYKNMLPHYIPTHIYLA